MRLSEILNIETESDVEISSLADNISDVVNGSLFFALKGENFDANEYVSEAVRRGAAAIVSEKKTETSAVLITVPDVRKTEAVAAAKFFGTANADMKIIGITGTNGKTTVAQMLFSIIRASGENVALSGTVENRINEEVFESEYTTPTPLLFHSFLAKAVEKGCKYCVSEVSSHALKQDRLYGIRFHLGIFTNISAEHSDYHGTSEDYINAKLGLFAASKRTLANLDCSDGKAFFTYPGVKTFSLENKNADYFCIDAKFPSDVGEYNLSAIFKTRRLAYPIKLRLMGSYNLSNALAAFAAADMLGFDLENTVSALGDFRGVSGRTEFVENDLGINVVIDYAHTPDALENVLSALRKVTKGRLIAVFGCGGNRDKKKRPEMGKIASQKADFVIVTSDNPRGEDPEKIIEDVLLGISRKNYATEINRYRAVRRALFAAKKGDTVLISGKGHEKKQIVSNRTVILSDRDIITEVLKEIKDED